MRKKTIIAALALSLSVISGAQQTKRITDWAHTEAYAPRNDTVTIRPKAVFMGDSITDNWGNRTHPEFFTEHNFLGRGISGQTTVEMLVRFRPDVIDLHPKYVVILAGTNDIAQNIGPISKEMILKNIQSMCELAKANKIKPILCSILPAYQFGWRKSLTPAEDIIEMNEMIKAYAKSAKIPYVDYHSAMKDERNGLPEKYSYDGVHPSMGGYEVMESIILNYIR